MKKHLLPFSLLLLSGLIMLHSCKPDDPMPEPNDGTTPYTWNLPANWPTPKLDPQNPLTLEGIELGRYLFYDPILSGNQTQSCASCHNMEFGFTDAGKRFSIGSKGDVGTMNSMPLFNLNWNTGYFWNGRQATIESLVKEPMEAHIEMNLSIDTAVARLKKHPEYPDRFRKAFPGKEISSTSLRYAIAQFLRSILSYSSRWDQYYRENPRNPEKLMTAAQARGYKLFTDIDKTECGHCHSAMSPFFTNILDIQYANNGLDANPAAGRMAVTGNPNDLGKFKTPSLRNIALTAPYMHDGRFATLEEVLDHYDSTLTYSPTISPMLGDHLDDNNKAVPRLTKQDKQDIIEFLKLLTDSSMINNPAFKNPF